MEDQERPTQTFHSPSSSSLRPQSRDVRQVVINRRASRMVRRRLCGIVGGGSQIAEAVTAPNMYAFSMLNAAAFVDRQSAGAGLSSLALRRTQIASRMAMLTSGLASTSQANAAAAVSQQHDSGVLWHVAAGLLVIMMWLLLVLCQDDG
mmetsp:Transcript_344/g.419  ORF Transcript_344/g.419 Transcript_344/m.419 type:complete len:149 (-) Transcript_344:301-747(-)